MALRITRSTNANTTTLRLEGRLDVAGLEDLRAECLDTEATLQLDLSGLRSVDEAGIEALRSLESGGVESHGASLYIYNLLKAQN